jgi:glycine/D-amino acid oxidase-like deaminating enzyme
MVEMNAGAKIGDPHGRRREAAGLGSAFANCVYPLTAIAAPPTPPLALDIRCRAVVVGGGYTGLSTAVHLAEQGIDVALLEAHEPGWGAAGRNGGQVNPGLKHEPASVERDFGIGHGPRLVQFAASAPDDVFALIERLQIRCEATREGTLRAARRPAEVALLRQSQRQWRARGVELALHEGEAARRITGTHGYHAVLHDHRGGAVNPLSLARGLTAAALAAGARVYGESRALSLQNSSGRWIVRTTGGSVTADFVVLATDGYSDALWPGLARSIIPIYSAVVATEPLAAELAQRILPTKAVLYEVGTVTAYYRKDAAGRLLIGGRSAQRPAAKLGDYRHLIAYSTRLWPALATVRMTHWWNGQFALTTDYYPRLHAPAPGVLIAQGYSGRGVALAIAMGRELAAAVQGRPLEDLPVPATAIRPIRFHRVWPVGVTAGMMIGRLRDRLGL